MNTSENAPSDKKIAIDSLDRDELIKRCKKLLYIAQKAKESKTDLTNEIAVLNEKLQSCDTQKQADKDCLKTMQLMIDSLTENKLTTANRIADLEKCVKNLTEQNAKKNADLGGLAQLQIENEAQKKQIDRLSRENEEQECDLQKLDERFAKVSELSQRQTQELLVLEQSIDRWKAMEAEYHKIQDECKTLREKSAALEAAEANASNAEHEAKIKALEEERDSSRRSYEDIEKQLEDLKGELGNIDRWKTMETEYNQLQDECKTLNDKLSAIEEAKESESTTLNAEYEATIKAIEEQRDNNRRMYEEVEKQLADLKIENDELKQSNEDDEKIDVLKEQLQHENQQLKKKCEEKSAKLNKYKTKVIEFSSDLKELKKSKKILYATVCEYSSSVGNWQTQITNAAQLLLSELDQSKDSKSLLENQVQEQCTKVDELKKTIDDLREQLNDVSVSSTSDANEIKARYETLLIDYKSLETEVHAKNDEIASITSEWEQICNSLKQKDTENTAALEKSTKQIDEHVTALAQMQSKSDLASKRNDELLEEMRELNDVLKTRGNVISTQLNELDQNKCKLQEQVKRINHLEKALSEKTDQLQSLQNQCDNQSIEMTKFDENLKEKAHQLEQLRNQFDSQSEILSTSTISRAEEVSRMKDVEDGFEDKYNKLRMLAVKLKKKCAEQQAMIVKYEATQAESGPAVNMQNLKSLQAENDRLLDKIDNMTIELKKLRADVIELTEQKQIVETELKSLKIVSEDIKATADTNQKIKSALDEQIRAKETQIEAIKGEHRNVTQQLKNAESEIVNVKDTVKQKDAEIQKKLDEITKLKAEMNKMQSSMKKHSVLNLEVEAYEKSLKEVSTKLETSTKQLNEAKNQSHQLEESMQGLNNDILALNIQLDLEKQNSNELQQQNDLQQIKVKEYNGEIIELKRIIDDHVKESNKMKIELTNLQSQQSENEIERQQFITKLKTDNEKSTSQLFALEDEVRELKTKLTSCEVELTNVQTEFASYKVRAQTVLRQNQSRDASDEEELREELTMLKQTKEDLTTKLNSSSEHQKRLTHTIDELKGEKQNLQDRCKKLLLVVEEARQQFETAQNENRKEAKEYQEMLKTHRLQIDTLNNCFRKQIDDMQTKHADEIATLKSMKSVNKVDSVDGTVTQTKKISYPELQRIEMIMSERQAGEGSESTLTSSQPRKLSTNSRNKHELVPLDELLNSSYEEEEETVAETEPHSDKFIAIDKFQAEQSRVNHLSTLLSEAEMDVTRLTEMNAMLKEEMRRQERSEEREKHMHNLEYMKNIIFKFLTISNADERAHLLPVLNIILKLSPDESRHLETIARGGEANQSGWSSILPMW